MATGDPTDIASRIRALLPGWFADASPTAEALLAGAAAALAFVYGLYRYAESQARILTASGIWLDLIARDFFGDALIRSPNQQDDSFRAILVASLFRPRATRRALSDMLLSLTGTPPLVLEPFAPADCGVWGQGFAGWGAAGGYGSLAIPAQCFVTAFRPVQYGIANVAGYGAASGGYGLPGEAEWASLAAVASIVSDADIAAVTDAAKPAGTTVWLRIVNPRLAIAITLDRAVLTLNGAPINL
ncbi:MAG: hypothetical protein KGK11_07695 [Sphingomonadales bacterium]|nr:hypothetical protein [Sphingomonadales bacterium]